jgi:N-acetyl-anhydromuramyl-L-alanine amidase AmpD
MTAPRPLPHAALAAALLGAGCASTTPHRADDPTAPGTPLDRRGDEIMVAGRLFHTGAPVVLWTDPGGYDAYRAEPRFTPFDRDRRAARGEPDTPQRYDLRADRLTEDEIERVRGGGWDLPTLQRVVDQFVIHYDACGTSEACFRVLHDVRHLSVHFLLDVDGTIYQTLDVKERAWHATTSNTRSVGIEIANMGAYASPNDPVLGAWYERTDDETVMTIPADRAGAIRTPGFAARPARPDPVRAVIQGRELYQYDLTPEQYDSLIRLTATLATVLPKIRLDYPTGSEGRVVAHTLPPEELASWTGLIAHWHIQDNKVDPGPAFDWDRVVEGARRLRRDTAP